MLTLCTLVPLRHTRLFFPSSSCSMLPPSLLVVDCLSPFLSGGPGPPSPPPFWADPISIRFQEMPYPCVGHSSFPTHFHAYFDLKYCSSKNLAKNICNKYIFFSRDVSRLFSDSKIPLKKSVFLAISLKIYSNGVGHIWLTLYETKINVHTKIHTLKRAYVYKVWVYLYMWAFI